MVTGESFLPHPSTTYDTAITDAFTLSFLTE